MLKSERLSVGDTPGVTRGAHEATVLVAGLGDLGTRAVHALARLPVGRLVAAAREAEHAAVVANRAGLVAELSGGAGRVEAAHLDLDDPEATARTFGALAPDVIVAAASRHSWWRTPPGLRPLPYGAWVSLHVPLVRAVTAAREAAVPGARVVGLPHPDAVGPILAGTGLAPDVGAGNVAEIAAKVRLAAARRAQVPREDVDVRIVAHHAAERHVLSLSSERDGSPEPETRPPVRAVVTVAGTPLGEDEIRSLLGSPFALGEARETHEVTAASTAEVVAALLADERRRLHAPAPHGRPGGYPVSIGRAGIALDLPPGLDEETARAVNAVASRWDGIEAIGPDGTVTFTATVAERSEQLLGLRLERVGPGEHEETGRELERRVRALA